MWVCDPEAVVPDTVCVCAATVLVFIDVFGAELAAATHDEFEPPELPIDVV